MQPTLDYSELIRLIEQGSQSLFLVNGSWINHTKTIDLINQKKGSWTISKQRDQSLKIKHETDTILVYIESLALGSRKKNITKHNDGPLIGNPLDF